MTLTIKAPIEERILSTNYLTISIPAKAGIRLPRPLDSGFRRSDGYPDAAAAGVRVNVNASNSFSQG